MKSTLNGHAGAMTPTTRFCRSSDGAGIAFGIKGSGTPLLAAPNWLTHLEYDWNISVWKSWFESLCADHTLIRYDLRGCGLSDRKTGELNLEKFVDDLEAVADAAGLDRFPLIGLCQGGAIAAAFAARRPERVSRLVLYGSYVQGGLISEGGYSTAEEVRALAILIEKGWGRQVPAFRELVAKLLIPDGSPEKIDALTRLEKQSTAADTARDLWLAFHGIDIAGLAPRIQAPTLIIHCRNDAMVPFSQGRLLATLIPDSRFLALEGRNHIVQEHDACWGRLWSEIRAFLREGETAQGPLENSFGLTRRERELLDLIARGRSNEEISGELCIAPKTVRNHVSNIFDKIRVTHRAEAIVRAREAGFGVSGHLPQTISE